MLLKPFTFYGVGILLLVFAGCHAPNPNTDTAPVAALAPGYENSQELAPTETLVNADQPASDAAPQPTGPYHGTYYGPYYNDPQKSLALAGFKCQTLRNLNLSCRGRLDNFIYRQEILIYIKDPHHLANRQHFTLFLHGHLGKTFDYKKQEFHDQTFDELLNDVYHINTTISELAGPEIVVVPFSQGKCQDYKDYFKDPKTFQLFSNSMATILNEAHLLSSTIDYSIVLAGHSGSYSTIAAILATSSNLISSVYLFDAMYGAEENFAQFILDHPKKRFFSIFMPYSETASANYKVWKLLSSSNESKSFVDFHLAAFRSEYLVPGSKELQKLQQTNPAFVISNKPHFSTFLFYFPKLLKN